MIVLFHCHLWLSKFKAFRNINVISITIANNFSKKMNLLEKLFYKHWYLTYATQFSKIQINAINMNTLFFTCLHLKKTQEHGEV
jgi:hypothetical protein